MRTKTIKSQKWKIAWTWFCVQDSAECFTKILTIVNHNIWYELLRNQWQHCRTVCLAQVTDPIWSNQWCSRSQRSVSCSSVGWIKGAFDNFPFEASLFSIQSNTRLKGDERAKTTSSVFFFWRSKSNQIKLNFISIALFLHKNTKGGHPSQENTHTQSPEPREPPQRASQPRLVTPRVTPLHRRDQHQGPPLKTHWS